MVISLFSPFFLQPSPRAFATTRPPVVADTTSLISRDDLTHSLERYFHPEALSVTFVARNGNSGCAYPDGSELILPVYLENQPEYLFREALVSSTKFYVYIDCAPMSCKHGTGPCAFGAVIYYRMR